MLLTQQFLNNSIIKFNLDIKNMSIAVASTTKNDAIKFTNNNWNFKQSEIFEYFKLNKLIFINDFVAQSLCFGSFYNNLLNWKWFHYKMPRSKQDYNH